MPACCRHQISSKLWNQATYLRKGAGRGDLPGMPCSNQIDPTSKKRRQHLWPERGGLGHTSSRKCEIAFTPSVNRDNISCKLTWIWPKIDDWVCPNTGVDDRAADCWVCPNAGVWLNVFCRELPNKLLVGLHIQTGLKTQEACLKTTKENLENIKFNKLYKVQGWHENPQLGRELFWQFWCVLLSRIMRFPPHLATNWFLSMTRTWYGSDLSKPIQGSKSWRLILEAKIASYSPIRFQKNQKRNC
jgi:hypothetical protein